MYLSTFNSFLLD